MVQQLGHRSQAQDRGGREKHRQPDRPLGHDRYQLSRALADIGFDQDIVDTCPLRGHVETDDQEKAKYQ